MTKELTEVWLEFLNSSGKIGEEGFGRVTSMSATAWHVVKLLLEDNRKLEERIEKLEKR